MSEKTKSKAGADAGDQEIERDHRKPESGRVIVAATVKEGRRRAGLDFSQAGTTIEFDEISEEQWKLILADPLLTIRPAPAKDKADQA